jgi:HAD superfamily hydrolase (TIGR01509 family)
MSIDTTTLLPAAVLFDMDGTLVQTEDLWYDAEAEIMAALDVEWGPDHQAQLVGGPLETAVDYMVRHTGGALTHEAMMALLLDTMERNLRTRPVEWCPGARELLLALEEAGVPCALVSASWRRLVEAVHDAVLHEVGHEMFATSVAGDEGERTKPFPDPYLLAAERIGVDPAHCVVLEDSHTGVAAGVASGALVVAIPSLVPIEGTDGLHVVESLEQVTPAQLGAWSHDWSPRV